MPTTPTPPPDPQPSPPLAAALDRLRAEVPSIPPALDAAILTSAADHLARPRRTFRLRPLLSLAAALALAAGGVAGWLTLTRPAPRPTDLNADGRVDILDAYRLALTITSAPAADPALDLNADGRVDRADADALAATVVRLNGGAS